MSSDLERVRRFAVSNSLSSYMHGEGHVHALRELHRDKVVVLCHGVFDILHPGHINHFISALSEGRLYASERGIQADVVLVVSVTADAYVDKGPGRPVFNQSQRMMALSSVRIIDEVVLSEGSTAEGIIAILQPDVFVKGRDYSGRDSISESDAVESVGGVVVLTDSPMYSSSAYINSHMNAYPETTQAYINQFKCKYAISELFSWLDDLEHLSFTVIGESIEDIYTMATPLSKSPRDPMIAYQRFESSTHDGGVLAVSNHIREFCSDVSVITQKNVITKERFFDPVKNQKFVAVQSIPSPLLGEREITDIYFNVLHTRSHRDASCVDVVMDYGHGFFVSKLRHAVEETSEFLAVNCQTNSHNYGFNPPTLWSAADYICMNQAEKQLADLHGGGHGSEAVGEPDTVVPPGWVHQMTTCGSEGSYLSSRGELLAFTPAFALSVVDTVGAGDSLFAITAGLLRLGCPPEIVGFIGNAMAALQCKMLGNSHPVTKKSLKRFLRVLLA